MLHSFSSANVFLHLIHWFLALKLWLKWSHDLGSSLNQKNLILSNIGDALRNTSDKNSAPTDVMWVWINWEKVLQWLLSHKLNMKMY